MIGIRGRASPAKHALNGNHTGVASRRVRRLPTTTRHQPERRSRRTLRRGRPRRPARATVVPAERLVYRMEGRSRSRARTVEQPNP